MLSTAVKTLYDQGRISTRQMLRFQFASGTYGFIAGRTDSLTHLGVEYKPFGLIEVSDIGGGIGTTGDGGFSLTLAEASEYGLTPDVLLRIEEEDYRDRPVVVMDAHFHPDTGELLQVETVARGYLDVIEHEADPDRGYVIIARCEGRQLDYSRRNGRVRSMADQQRRSSGDKFFQHAGQAGRVEVYWGRVKAAVASSNNSVGTVLQNLIKKG